MELISRGEFGRLDANPAFAVLATLPSVAISRVGHTTTFLEPK
jgi:hypothetical protein